jgi:hypothetical protein
MPLFVCSSRKPASAIRSSSAEKYRRMRDLNNVASKRCRSNRKLKIQNMEQEVAKEMERNSDLKMKVRLLEEQVSILHNFIFARNFLDIL